MNIVIIFKQFRISEIVNFIFEIDEKIENPFIPYFFQLND